MKRTSRRPSKLSSALQRNLNAYALAASAAGVGILAVAQPPAEAKIIYTKAHVVIGHGGHHLYRLDLNHDKVPDFLIGTNTSYFYEFRVWLLATAPRGDWVQGQLSKNGRQLGIASNLPWGAKIDRGQKFFGATMAEIFQGGTGTNYSSAFWCNRDRYLGLRFKITGKPHFGWARFNVVCHATYGAGKPTITATLTGYAYETIGYKGIIAGKTKGPDPMTVQPASLGHLSRGASAIPAWRGKDQ